MVARCTYTRLLTAPAQSFFLLGLRGSGKSTWARQAFPDARRFDLLDGALYQDYLRDPGLFGPLSQTPTSRGCYPPTRLASE